MRFLLLFLFSITSGVTFAQDYPTRPVRLIEPFGAGGGPDVVARAISPKLSELWGQPVIVENHPGKGSTEAPALVAKSPPDGYTLLVNTSAQAYSAALVKTLPAQRLHSCRSPHQPALRAGCRQVVWHYLGWRAYSSGKGEAR